jgi:hypothetical protein
VAVSAAERRLILNELGKRSQQDMIRLWDAAGRFADVDFFKFVSEAFPDIVIPYHQAASEIAAEVFQEDFPEVPFPAVTVDPPDEEALIKSAQWALGADGTKALDRMSGTLNRHIYNGERDTTVFNAEINGMRYMRVAKPDACGFCRMLASRTSDLYRSEEAALGVVGRSVNLSIADRRAIASGQMSREEALYRRDQMQLIYQIGRRKGSPRGRRPRGSRVLGDPYHDWCQCTAQAVPINRDPIEYLFEIEPDYALLAEQWNREYLKAREMAGSGDPKKILSEWRTFGPEVR